MKEFSGN